MSVEYPIQSLASRLKLSAISALHGKVITDDLVWTIRPLKDAADSIISELAQPCLELHPKEYQIDIEWAGKEVDGGRVSLKQGYCLDVVVLIQEFGEPDAEEGYFVDPDEVDRVTENERRQLERDEQRQYGAASGPLANPYPPEGEMGQGFAQHPLLDNARFDGMPPEVSAEPNTNEEAVEKTKEHVKQLQAQLQNAPGSAPSLTQ